MRVFLTGSHDLDWRCEITDFLTRKQIDFFDPSDYPPEFSSIFKQLKILEGCDLLIAYFAGIQTRHLRSMLEISYASKLVKEVMIVDDIPRIQSWVQIFPYSKSFPDLNGVKDYLTQMLISQNSQPQSRFFG